MKLLFSVFRVYRSKTNSRSFYNNALAKDYSVVNESIIKDSLEKNSIKFTEGYTCFCVKPCFCGQKKKNSTNNGDVFINKRTGFFLCGECKVTADWNVYSNLLSEPNLTKESFDKHFVSYSENIKLWEDIVKNTENLEYLTDEACRDVFKSFNLAPFSRSVLEKLKIKISPDRNLLYFPLYHSDCVVGFKTLNKNGEESVFPRINCPGVLQPSQLRNAKAAVVVSNINDFLALVSVNLSKYDVICLPHGASHLPQSSLPIFEKYTKIVLWLGEKCLDTVGNIAEKFYDKRCYVIKPSKNRSSASAAVSDKQNIVSALSEAKLSYHQFVTTFNSFRDEVWAEMQNVTEVVGVPWKKFPSLNKILKGHRRGELTILTGPTGVGKTTFLSQYSLDLASQGVHTLWGSFEIKNIRLAKIMLTQYAEAPLPQTLPEFNSVCDKFEQLPVFFLTFHGQQNVLNVMDAVRHCSYIYDIAHVIIDNVQFMIEVYSNSSVLDRFSQQDYMIQLFRSFASENNCHVTLVMHPKKIEHDDLAVNSIFGGVKASQEADNILIMQKHDSTQFNSTKHLEVAKNRFSGDLGSIPLSFNKPSLSFSEKVVKDTNSDEVSERQRVKYNEFHNGYDEEYKKFPEQRIYKS